MPEMLLEDGDALRDTYVVERFIGEGAFAQVYRVRHRFLGRQAMKVMKSERTSQAEAEEMLSEAALLSRIGHPNIIRVYDAGLLETRLGVRAYFTMEYVPGGNLDGFWRSHGREFVPIADTVEIMKQICRGLEVAHSQDPPVIHRDIKPQNILVGYDVTGIRVRIGDFGLAKRVDPLSLVASARGTVGFKPPEFLSGMDSTTSDVWAVGCVLYLLLADRMPFPEIGSEWDPSRLRLAPPSKFNLRVDGLLDEIASRSLAVSPTDRYRHAGEMLRDLGKWNAGDAAKSLKSQFSLGLAKSTAPQSGGEQPDTGKMVEEAMRLSLQADRLMEAADILEQALNLKPQLRGIHEYQVRLWRRGVLM
jgi:serine/threonine-protein kinase